MVNSDRFRRLALSFACILCVWMTSEASASTTGPVQLENLVLYQPSEVLELRIPDPRELSAYARRLLAESSNFWSDFPDRDPCYAWLVIAVLPAGQVRIWPETTEPSPTTGTLERLRSRLEAIPAVQVTGGPVIFALHLSVFGGRARDISSADFTPHTPQAWHDAARNAGTTEPQLLESLLEIIWPVGTPGGGVQPPGAQHMKHKLPETFTIDRNHSRKMLTGKPLVPPDVKAPLLVQAETRNPKST